MRGGPGNEGRLTVDGLSLGASLNGTGVSYTVADVGNAQEVVFSTAGGLGEAENAGPAMNLVPRQGGNRLSGNFFANGANGSMQSNNFSDEIRRAGLRAPNALSRIWDTSARGRRSDHARSPVVLLGDALSGQPSARRRHVPQPQRRRRQRLERTCRTKATRPNADSSWKNVSTRLTWQASPRNKFNFYWDEQRNCTLCNDGGTADHLHPRRATTTSRRRACSRRPGRRRRRAVCCIEAGFGTNLILNYGPQPNLANSNAMIPVTEQCTAGCAEQRRHRQSELPRQQLVHRRQRRVQLARGRDLRHRTSQCEGRLSRAVHRQQVSQSAQNDAWLNYRVNNGIPNQLTMTAGPAEVHTHVSTGSFYVQDQWTSRRLDDLGRASLRPRVEPLPAAAARAEPVLSDGGHLRPVRRRLVQRHHAALRRRLRRVRQRQDGPQGQHRQVSRRRRWQLDHRRTAQSADARLDDGEPHVDRCQPELQARLRSAQPAAAGSQRVWR